MLLLWHAHRRMMPTNIKSLIVEVGASTVPWRCRCHSDLPSRAAAAAVFIVQLSLVVLLLLLLLVVALAVANLG